MGRAPRPPLYYAQADAYATGLVRRITINILLNYFIIMVRRTHPTQNFQDGKAIAGIYCSLLTASWPFSSLMLIFNA